MCLYPKLILNRKYLPNKSNGMNPPECKDERTKYVPVGCGKCMECRKMKQREWSVRLNEEIKHNKGLFTTLTFSNESIYKLGNNVSLSGYERDNYICKYAIRHFLERHRAKTGKSIRHWAITELGHEGSENVHIHGIFFNCSEEDIKNSWNYGFIHVGEYVDASTVNYITKYVTKVDKEHEYYIPRILCSKGIGKGYLKSYNSKSNKYKGKDTKTTYTTSQGLKLALPIYYRNHLYNDEQKESLWLNLLDKNERYVNGQKVDVSINTDNYYKLLEFERVKNKNLGFGDDVINWEKKIYEQTRRNMLFRKRINNAKDNQNDE